MEVNSDDGQQEIRVYAEVLFGSTSETILGGQEMALPGDLGFLTMATLLTPVSGDPLASSDLHGHQALGCTDTCRQNTLMHIITFFNFKKKNTVGKLGCCQVKIVLLSFFGFVFGRQQDVFKMEKGQCELRLWMWRNFILRCISRYSS